MQFQNDRYYHIYNRGVDKRKVFEDEKHYLRFLRSLREFNSSDPIGSLYEKSYRERMTGKKEAGVKESNSQLGIGFLKAKSGFPDNKLISIICYCLNFNHYHLLLKQSAENGISKFMHKLGLGYTNYFNAKNKRSGALFQGKYKAVELKSCGRLLEVSLYVNGNYEIHGLGLAREWQWSSCRDYLGLRKGTLCAKNEIMADFSDPKEYEELLNDYVKDKKAWKQEAKLLEY